MAAVAAEMATFPLDTPKTRQQLQGQGGGADQHLQRTKSSPCETICVRNNQVWFILLQQGCGEAPSETTSEGKHPGQPLLCSCCRKCVRNFGHTNRCDQGEDAEWEHAQGRQHLLVSSLGGQSRLEARGHSRSLEGRIAHRSKSSSGGRSPAASIRCHQVPDALMVCLMVQLATWQQVFWPDYL